MGQRAESVEEHRGELYDQYQREEEDEYKTDRLELQVLLRDVYLQNHDVYRTRCDTQRNGYFSEAMLDGDRNPKRINIC